MTARFSLAHPASCAFSTPSTTSATSDRRTGGAVFVGEHQRREPARFEELIVGRDRVVLARAVDVPLGWLTLAADERRADVLYAEPGAGERRGIDLHAHRWLLPAVQRHEPHARHLRDLLREDRIGEVVDVREAAACRSSR